MELKKILTEEELGALPEGVGAKLEAAYNSELQALIESERKKSGKKLQVLMENISAKAEAKIEQAITENISTMRSNAMNDKMAKLIRGMAGLLENAGIPVSEDMKRLKAELDASKINVQKAYAQYEHVKEMFNDQEKKCFIYKSVQGMRPEVVDAVMNHFIHLDIREITPEAISDFLHGKTAPIMADIDPEADSDLDLSKATAALKEIDHEFELDNPAIPRGTPSYANGAKASPMRYDLHTPNVSYGMEESVGNTHGISPDVADAITAMHDYGTMGLR